MTLEKNLNNTNSESLKKVIWPGSTQLFPVPAVLVSCNTPDHKGNLITVAWTGIACSNPPMLTVAIKPERFSYNFIRQSKEFAVNIPSAALAAKVDWCGVKSGRDFDKFKEMQLSKYPSSRIDVPLVAECPINLECKVSQILELGGHHLFVADILAVQVSEEFLEPNGRLNVEKENLLAFAHGHYYTLGECLGHFGFSVRRKKGTKIRR